MNAEISMMIHWIQLHPVEFLALFLWTFIWKGIALWKAAERQEKYWFGMLLIVNTLGILDLIYIFFVARRTHIEIVEG